MDRLFVSFKSEVLTEVVSVTEYLAGKYVTYLHRCEINIDDRS